MAPPPCTATSRPWWMLLPPRVHARQNKTEWDSSETRPFGRDPRWPHRGFSMTRLFTRQDKPNFQLDLGRPMSPTSFFFRGDMSLPKWSYKYSVLLSCKSIIIEKPWWGRRESRPNGSVSFLSCSCLACLVVCVYGCRCIRAYSPPPSTYFFSLPSHSIFSFSISYYHSYQVYWVYR